MQPAHRNPRHDLKARARKQISLLPFYFCLLNSGRKNITMKRILTSKAYALIVCTLIAAAFGVGSAMAATTEPKEAKLTELMSKDLTDLPGKEGLMLMIEYPPGSSDPIHRHNAHGFIYVLEGSIVMQVRGGKEVTLTPGQTFYEGPEDVHVVGRNASQTKPAKFVVFFVKDKGAPVLVPTK
jgi:quercetin dioxygenase-like cupin family protein